MQTLLRSRRAAWFLGATLVLVLAPRAAAQWTAGPSLANARHGLGVVRHGGDIYAIGGWGSPTSLEVLSSGASSWAPRAPLPIPQEGVAAALVNGRIYACGSYVTSSSATCQIYDIASDTWLAGPPPPQGLQWASAEAIGTDVYVIGGYSAGVALNTLYILDTTTLTWRQGAPIPAAIQIPATVVHDGFIYAFGRSPLYYKYSLSSGTWSAFAGPPSGHGAGSEAVSVGHFVYFIGGSSGSITTAYSTVEIFDPLTSQWSTGPSLANGRYQFGAVYLPLEGNLYAVGGRDGSAGSMTSVEVLPAVPNGFQRYGTGTGGTGRYSPDLAGGGTAAVGASITLDLTRGLGGAPCGVLVGLGPASKTQFRALGVTVLVHHELFLGLPLGGAIGAPGAGSGSLALQIPTDPLLVGANVNFQALVLDTGAPELVSASNGLALWIR